MLTVIKTILALLIGFVLFIAWNQWLGASGYYIDFFGIDIILQW